MTLQVDDTIVALSSASGPGGRAIVRMSGPRAFSVAMSVFRGNIGTDQRGLYPGIVVIPGLSLPVPADLYHFPAPHSATGQSVVELHLISCAPIVEVLIAELLRFGARPAHPGEYSLRAFLSGKLDLPRAEAIVGVIESSNRDELKRSLRQLAGGVSEPLKGLREDMLDMLADIEAGLDFVDEDIEFVNQEELLQRIARGLAQVSLVKKQVEDRGLVERPFRVAIVGPPNAGKSSLFNVLTGRTALVSDIPGTTRDYLTGTADLDGITVEMIDTAGWRDTHDPLEALGQRIAGREVERGDLILQCVPAAGRDLPAARHDRNTLVIATKCDLEPAAAGIIGTSVVTGFGLDALRAELRSRAQAFAGHGLAPSLSRCRHHVDACLSNLRAAHQGVLFSDPAEIVALELRAAVEQLGAMTGAVYTDDLLDRIFSRFCIGK